MPDNKSKNSSTSVKTTQPQKRSTTSKTKEVNNNKNSNNVSHKDSGEYVLETAGDNNSAKSTNKLLLFGTPVILVIVVVIGYLVTTIYLGNFETKIAIAENKITDYENKEKKYVAERKSMTSTINKFEQELSDSQELNEKLQKELIKKDKTILAKSSQVSKLSKKIASLEAKLSVKFDEIDDKKISSAASANNKIVDNSTNDTIVSSEANSSTDVQNSSKSDENKSYGTEMLVTIAGLRNSVLRGEDFSESISKIKQFATNSNCIIKLEKYARMSVPTFAEISKNFDDVINKIDEHIVATQKFKPSGSFWKDMWQRFKLAIKLRPKSEQTDIVIKKIIDKVKKNIGENNLVKAIEEAEKLTGESRKIINKWLNKAKDRVNLDTITDKLTKQLIDKFSDLKAISN